MIYDEIQKILESGDGKEAMLRLAEKIDDIETIMKSFEERLEFKLKMTSD